MATLSGTNTGAFKGTLVRVYDRNGGAFLGATISNASTGAWSFTTPNTKPCIAYAMASAGDIYGDKLVFASEFDGTNGGTLSTDVTGKTLTWNNGLTLSSAQAYQGATSIGPISGTKALTFSATGLSMPNTASHWIRAYIYPTSTPGTSAHVFGVSTRTPYKGLSFGFNGLNVTLDVPNTGTFTGSNVPLNINQWNRFDVSIINGYMYFFVNGTLSLSNNRGSNTPIWESAGSIIVGNASISGTFNCPFPGYIDLVEFHYGMDIGSTSFTPADSIGFGFPGTPTENCLIFDNLTPV